MTNKEYVINKIQDIIIGLGRSRHSVLVGDADMARIHRIGSHSDKLIQNGLCLLVGASGIRKYIHSSNNVFTKIKIKTMERTNNKFIVRCDRSGVFYGEIEGRNGREVTMRNVRQIWCWYGAAALPQLALEGTSRPAECKFTVTLDELTVLDCIEFIPCSDKAVESLDGVKEWRA